MRWVGTSSLTEVISVDDTLKAHCKLAGTGTTYDTELTAFIKSAGGIIEQVVGYPLRYTAITVYYDTTSNRVIRLPKNISTITTYYYQDGDEYVEQTFTDIVRDDYQLYSELRSTEIKQNARYKIVCTSTVNASEVVKNACRVLVSQMFENRENGELKATGGVTNYGQWLDIYLAGEIAHNL